jgi:hypothetical protein
MCNVGCALMHAQFIWSFFFFFFFFFFAEDTVYLGSYLDMMELYAGYKFRVQGCLPLLFSNRKEPLLTGH